MLAALSSNAGIYRQISIAQGLRFTFARTYIKAGRPFFAGVPLFRLRTGACALAGLAILGSGPLEEELERLLGGHVKPEEDHRRMGRIAVDIAVSEADRHSGVGVDQVSEFRFDLLADDLDPNAFDGAGRGACPGRSGRQGSAGNGEASLLERRPAEHSRTAVSFWEDGRLSLFGINSHTESPILP